MQCLAKVFRASKPFWILSFYNAKLQWDLFRILCDRPTQTCKIDRKWNYFYYFVCLHSPGTSYSNKNSCSVNDFKSFWPVFIVKSEEHCRQTIYKIIYKLYKLHRNPTVCAVKTHHCEQTIQDLNIYSSRDSFPPFDWAEIFFKEAWVPTSVCRCKKLL